MRLARIGDPGRERPLVAGADGVWRDLSPVAADIRPDVFGSLGGVDIGQLSAVSTEGVRFGPPLVGIGKIICVGLNYRDHAEETNSPMPSEPILFMKAPDTVVGCADEVRIPRSSTKTDWEVELAVVIGREAAYLDSPEAARDHVFGYAISDDVSERAFQLERGGQWDKGKNCATFNPFGPWIRTVDEVPDPQQLRLRTRVNGELRQDGTTANMIFGVDHLVWYVSQFMTLRPGDVINTGTPAGVAMGLPGQPYLRRGDVVEIEIDGLGRQRHCFGEA